jgi:hypothetical protein
MASSSHVRRRLEKNAHMLEVPSSSGRRPLHYPPFPGLITFRAVRPVSSDPLRAANGAPCTPVKNS